MMFRSPDSNEHWNEDRRRTRIRKKKLYYHRSYSFQSSQADEIALNLLYHLHILTFFSSSLHQERTKLNLFLFFIFKI